MQFPIAEVAAKLDAARLLTIQAARMRDAGLPHTAAGAKAKLFASAVAVEAADIACRPSAATATRPSTRPSATTGTPRSPQIYEGTSEIQRLVIARDLLGDAAR